MNFPNNRNKSRTKKSTKGYYCFGCDRNFVRSGGKCDLCGKKDVRKRDKKIGPSE